MSGDRIVLTEAERRRLVLFCAEQAQVCNDNAEHLRDADKAKPRAERERLIHYLVAERDAWAFINRVLVMRGRR